MRNEQREKWWAALEETEVDVFSEHEIRELSIMLQTSVMRKALAIVLSKVPQFAASLLNVDLGSDEGIRHAQKMQSQAGGIVRAVELLGELATEEKEKTSGQEDE